LGTNGAAEVKAHPFFRNIQWETLHETETLFVPKVTNPEVISLIC